MALLLAVIAGGASIPLALGDEDRGSVPKPAPSPTRYRFPRVQSRPPQPRTPPDDPCRGLYLGLDGNPMKYGSQTLARYEVPDGRRWRITNTSVMMERHHGGA